jgi:sarcosine oxidase
MGVESVTYDVAVAGLGGMGSAALAHCAVRSVRAIGIEQFDPVHLLGSSAGKSRIIRQAYYEDPAYVPLLFRAYELWRELERRTGEELMRLTGLLMVGREDRDVITGSARAAREYDVPVEYCSADQVRVRYPHLQVRDDEVAVYEPNGGAVFPERAIHAQLGVARDAGADMRFDTSVRSWDADAQALTLDLSDGTRVRTRSLVLTLGPWFAHFLQDLGVQIDVQRNVQVWFDPVTDVYDAARFPAFLLERDSLPAPLYGLPNFGEGVKAAFHGYGELTTAGELVREIDRERDVDPVARALEKWMPGASSRYREAKACMYSLTPDRHFVVDRHPHDGRIILCGGFSGHGFKFAPVIGEIASHLALDGETTHDIGFLSLRRFRG